MTDKDLVKHHYNRRGLVGPQAMLFRRNHPMSWTRVSGNYQTWQLNVLPITPTDAESRHGQPVKLFYSDDLAIWFSRRKETMPYFFRNCDADEVNLISRGEMIFETDFGDIEVGEREILLIPKGVTYRRRNLSKVAAMNPKKKPDVHHGGAEARPSTRLRMRGGENLRSW